MTTAATTFEVQGQPPLVSPSLETVIEWLGRIHPRGPSFLKLTRPDGSYVQCTGARLRLIVEFRRVTGRSFQHFVLGRAPASGDVISMDYCGGRIALRRNEILALSEAADVFAEFHRTGDAPAAFLRRDITSEHGAKAKQRDAASALVFTLFLGIVLTIAGMAFTIGSLQDIITGGWKEKKSNAVIVTYRLGREVSRTPYDLPIILHGLVLYLLVPVGICFSVAGIGRIGRSIRGLHELRRKKQGGNEAAEQGASPNSGPAASVDNSNALDGPPSVS